MSYFEILQPRWPDASARTVIAKKRPFAAAQGQPYLTFTHGEAWAEP